MNMFLYAYYTGISAVSEFVGRGGEMSLDAFVGHYIDMKDKYICRSHISVISLLTLPLAR